MTRSIFSIPRAFIAFSALALVVIGSGCTSNAGGDGAGGDGGGNAQPTTTTPCTMAGASRSCAAPGDPPDMKEGEQTCVKNESGDLVWTVCAVNAPVTPTSSSTPLVLSFDGAPITFQSSVRAFAINGTMSVATDWPTSRTPWLALDRNGNGAVDDGGELFGSATVLKSGERAENGFIALRELDTDGDGQLTPADAGWSQLRLWNDSNSDRVSSGAELTGLGARRLVSIDLGYAIEKRCDDRGNCEVERAGFRYVDEAGVERSGVVIDVHLAHK